MFPASFMAHRNSIRLLQLQPTLSKIKMYYSGNKERLNEEQYNLFKKEKYSPFLGLIPLFLQLILIIGVMQVMLNPMRHMHGINEATIDFMFLGLNLRTIPSFTNPSPELIVPLFSGGAGLAFCLIQNAISPGALSQSKATNIGLTIFTVSLSLYLALVLPVGVGLYWTTANLFSIVVVLFLCAVQNPKKLAGQAIEYIKATQKKPKRKQINKQQNKDLYIREERDIERFKKAKKQLVFYALAGGQYKYYKNIIEYILEHSEIIIHYLTNDPNDPVFKLKKDNLSPYYTSQKKTISLLLKLDANIFVTTVSDLQIYHMKRSILRDDIEYINIPHGLASLHMTGGEKSFDNYDTIFCVGIHQVDAFRKREEMFDLKRKNLVKAGYGVYDQLVSAYENIGNKTGDKPQILIAPSWQPDSIMDICINNLLDVLLGKGYKIIVRPHPQYVRMFPERMEFLAQKYEESTKSGELTLTVNFLENDSIYQSDIIISDWSNIAYEFSYSTKKPSIFINTPMKVMNPNYEKLGVEVLDITLRDKVGVSIDLENIHETNDTITRLLLEKEAYKDRITNVVNQYLFHPGRSGEAGGTYIINALNARKNA